MESCPATATIPYNTRESFIQKAWNMRLKSSRGSFFKLDLEGGTPIISSSGLDSMARLVQGQPDLTRRTAPILCEVASPYWV